MKLQAQVTLDLPNAAEKERKAFYEVLEAEKWRKVKDVTTAWTMTFNENVSPKDALEIVKADLEAASQKSRASYVASIAIGFAPVKVTGHPT